MSRRRTVLALAVTAALAATVPAAADAAAPAGKLRPVAQTKGAAHVVAKVRGAFPRAPKVHLTPEMRADRPLNLDPRGRSGPVDGPAGQRVGRPAAAPDARFNGSVGTYDNKLAWSLYYIDRYWAGTMTGYQTPTIYPGMERYSGIYCGNTRLSTNNAWYCPNFITWDTNFLYKFFARSGGGDMAMAAILAHEWGHLSAYQLGLRSTKLNTYSFYREVYADCQSGAFTANLSRQGKLDNLGVGDVNEAVNAMLSVGDAAGTPWYSEGAHGDGTTRKNWWIYGWNFGPQACINAVM
jgi:uncharacterized protein